MLTKRFDEICDKTIKAAMEINKKKGHDYASDDGRLSNFERVAGAIRALEIDAGRPYGFALVMMIVKIDRLNNLVRSGKTPKNESLFDTNIDGLNYWLLTGACVEDELEARKVDEPKGR